MKYAKFQINYARKYAIYQINFYYARPNQIMPD